MNKFDLRDLSVKDSESTTSTDMKRQKFECSYCSKIFYSNRSSVMPCTSKYGDLSQLRRELERAFCPQGPCRQLFRYSNPDEAVELRLPLLTTDAGLLKASAAEGETERGTSHTETAAERRAVLPAAQLPFLNALFELFALDFVRTLFTDLLEDLQGDVAGTDDFLRLIESQEQVLDPDVDSFSGVELYSTMLAVKSLTESICINKHQPEILNKTIGFLNAMLWRHDEKFEGQLSQLFNQIVKNNEPGQLQTGYSKIPANQRALHYFIYMLTWSILDKLAPEVGLSGDPKSQEQAKEEHQELVNSRINVIISKLVTNFVQHKMMVDLTGLISPDFEALDMEESCDQEAIDPPKESEPTGLVEEDENEIQDGDSEKSDQTDSQESQDEKHYLSMISLNNLSEKIENVLLKIHMPGPLQVFTLEVNFIKGNQHLDKIKISKIRRLVQDQFLAESAIEKQSVSLWKQQFAFLKREIPSSKDDFVSEDSLLFDLLQSNPTSDLDLFVSRLITVRDEDSEGEYAEVVGHSSLRIKTPVGTFNVLYSTNMLDRKFFERLKYLGLIEAIPSDEKIQDKPISTTLKEKYGVDPKKFHPEVELKPAEVKPAANQAAQPAAATTTTATKGEAVRTATPHNVKLKMDYDANEALRAFMKDEDYKALVAEVNENSYYPSILVVGIPTPLKPAVAEILLGSIENPSILLPKKRTDLELVIKSMVLRHTDGTVEVLRQSREGVRQRLNPAERPQLISSLQGLRAFGDSDVQKIVRLTYERRLKD